MKSLIQIKYSRPIADPSWKGSVPNQEIKKILIIHTAFLGDLILSSAMVHALHKLSPQAQIDYVAIPQTAFALNGNPHITNVWIFDKRDKSRKKQEFNRLIAQIKTQNYDLAIIPHRSMTTARIIKQAGIAIRIGYSRPWFARFFYSIRVKFRFGISEIERQLDLLRPLFAKFSNKDAYSHVFPLSWQTELFPTDSDKDKATQLLAPLLKKSKTKKRQPLIAIAPGSVWFTKKWPEQHFTELVRLLNQQQFHCILVGGPEDRRLSERISNNNPLNIITAGHTSILESAAVIEQSSLLVCNDSAPLHIANAMNTPVIALFGATSPIFGFGPYRDHDRIVENNALACHPCRSHGSASCPRSHFRCMQDLSPKQVFLEIKNMLNIL